MRNTTTSGIFLVIIIQVFSAVKCWVVNVNIGYVVARPEDYVTFDLVKNYASKLSKRHSTNRKNVVFHIKELSLSQNIQEGKDVGQQMNKFELVENPALFLGPENTELIESTERPYVVLRDGPVSLMDCGAHDQKSAISVLPPLRKVLAVQIAFLFTQNSVCKSFAVIAETEDDMNEYLEVWKSLIEDESSLFTCLSQFPFVIRSDDDIQLIRLRSLSIEYIVLYSYDINYITKILAMARKLNIVTHLYKWLLLYSDGELPHDQLEILKNDKSILSTVNIIINTAQFLLLGDVPKLGERVLNAAILDSLIILRKYGEFLAKNESLGSANSVNITSNDIWNIYRSNPLRKTRGVTGEIDNFQTPCITADLKTQLEVFTAYRGQQFGKSHAVILLSSDPRNITELFSKHIRAKVPPEDVAIARERIVQESNRILGYWKLDPKRTSKIFNRQNIRVVTRADPPFVFKDKNGVITGMTVDYMRAYAKWLQFTPEFYLVEDGEMGREKRDGSGWTGMVEELLHGEADLVAGAFSIDVNRSRVIDYTEPTFPGTVSLLMKAPNVVKTRWQFLKPFTTQLWVLVLGLFLVMSFLLNALTRIDYQTETISLSDSFYFSMAILTNGSSETNPTAIPTRIMVAVLMFFGIVLAASYTANMTAFLTLRNDQEIVRTLETLATHGNVKYGVVNNSEIMNILHKSVSYPELILWSKINHDRVNSILPDYETAVQKVRTDTYFILISESVITNYFVDKYCDLISIPQDLYSVRYAIAYPQGLRIKQAFDEVISAVREYDMKETQIYKKWYPGKKCDNRLSISRSKLETKPLTLYEMSGVFISLAIGVCLSFIVAVIGHFWIKHKNKRKTNDVVENGEPNKKV